MIRNHMAPFRGLRRIAIALALAATAGGAAFVARDATAQSRASRPWLGVSMEAKPGAAGVIVKHVVRTSPADKAGIREADRLLKVDGTSVATSQEVVRVVGTHGVGDVIPVVVARGTSELTVRVSLTGFPGPDEMMKMDHLGSFAPAWKGVSQVSGSVPSSIAALRGRVVIMDFWATWCGPCRLVAPKLNALHAKYGAQGLSIIGLSSEPIEEVSLFAQRMSMRYAIGVDKGGETTQAYTVSSLPTLFVIDKRGVVRDIAIGYDPMRDAQIEALVKTLLAEPAPTD
jgi:thiol-disulfide isomerase/thioredoxin